MHIEAKICKLDDRRNVNVYNFMFKQKNKLGIIDIREIRTRAHDALLYTTKLPLCENISVMFLLWSKNVESTACKREKNRYICTI